MELQRVGRLSVLQPPCTFLGREHGVLEDLNHRRRPVPWDLPRTITSIKRMYKWRRRSTLLSMNTRRFETLRRTATTMQADPIGE